MTERLWSLQLSLPHFPTLFPILFARNAQDDLFPICIVFEDLCVRECSFLMLPILSVHTCKIISTKFDSELNKQDINLDNLNTKSMV